MLILILFSIFTSLIIGFVINTFWFRYILFLVIVGGILVVFVYITRVASNEKFFIKYKFFNLFLIFIIFFIILYVYIKNFSKNTDLILNSYEYIINKFFIFPYYTIILLIIIYLLVTLIVVVKITQLKLGPLRQKY